MRSGITKSRDGCMRCKRQKVRCDQVKPSCGRCSRVGVECPGPSKALKWSTKYEKLNTQNDRPSVPPATLLPVSPEEVEDTTIEDVFPMDFSDLMLSGFPSGISFSPIHSITEVDSPQSFQSPAPVVTDIDNGEDQSIQIEHDNTDSLFSVNGSSGIAQRPQSSHPSRSLSDVSTVLTEYYFKEAASLYSVYDSAMNPFRSTVSQLWKSSRLLHCSLQSMSAACLLDHFPHLSTVGNELRKEAITILQSQQEYDHTSLLALLMLGGSSSWHETSNLGLKFFNVARKRLDEMVRNRQLQRDSNNYHFFEEALIYWELLLSYVADDGELQPAEIQESSERSVYFPSRHIPHPWTGVARDTQVTVQKVGRLIRRTRVMARSGQFTTEESVLELQRSISEARGLEAKLLTFVYPNEIDVVSPGDRVTPVWHLLTLAEIYRRTGLIQLYRVFPDLLCDRLHTEDDHPILQPTVSTWFSEDPPAAPPDERAMRNEWLTTYTLETLKMLETIPIESGTRDFQPFLLVSLCSELRLPEPTSKQCGKDNNLASSSSVSCLPDFGIDTVDHSPIQIRSSTSSASDSPQELSLRSIEIVRTRQFILDRLISFLRILPPKPMHVCIEIVKASWERLDEMQRMKLLGRTSRRDVYWMDVMMDNAWETCMA